MSTPRTEPSYAAESLVVVLVGLLLILAANAATVVMWAAFAVLLLFVAVAPAPPLRPRTFDAERPPGRRLQRRGPDKSARSRRA